MWIPVSVDPVNATTIVKELSHLLEEKRTLKLLLENNESSLLVKL